MSKRQLVFCAVIVAFMWWVYIINRPRLAAYNDCYTRNYDDWGVCNELGGGY